MGCPVGAVASWAIYNVLKNYGNISYYKHYSGPYDKVVLNVPGLIFIEFKSSSIVDSLVIYIYNEYLNATTYGIPIPINELVSVSGQELQNELPSLAVPFIS